MTDSLLADLQLSTIDITRCLTAQNIALRLPGSSARHDSVRRHVRPDCGRAFNRAAHLRVHAGIHSRAAYIAMHGHATAVGRHICSICRLSYLSIDSLRHYMQRKHVEHPDLVPLYDICALYVTGPILLYRAFDVRLDVNMPCLLIDLL
jgi:hypothetical protein